MKRLFLVLVLFISVVAANAQVDKAFADLKNAGNAAVNSKDYVKALDLYEQALVKWGDKPIADTSMIYNMGYCALSAKNYEKALKYFDQAITLNYKKVNALLYKADIYRVSKKNDECLKALEAAIAVAPNDAKVKSKLASYWVKEATSVYTKASGIITKLNADITSGKLKTTDAAYVAGEEKAKAEYQKALPLIDKALEYDPANATAKQLKTACEQVIKG